MYMQIGKEIRNDLCSTKYINDLSSLTYNTNAIFNKKVSYFGYLLNDERHVSSRHGMN